MKTLLLKVGKLGYVGNCDETGSNSIVPKSQAMRLDERDNAELKARFFTALLLVKVTPEPQ